MLSLFHVDIFVCITELDTVMPVITVTVGGSGAGTNINLWASMYMFVCICVCVRAYCMCMHASVHAKICLLVFIRYSDGLLHGMQGSLTCNCT